MFLRSQSRDTAWVEMCGGYRFSTKLGCNFAVYYFIMCMIARLFWVVMTFAVAVSAAAQGTVTVTDSVACDSIEPADTVGIVPKMPEARADNPYRVKPWAVVIPTALVGVGIIGLESDWLKSQNQENIDRKLTIDDFSQYAPMAVSYVLPLFGVRAKHSFVERTVILGTAYALMGLTVNTLKVTTRVQRPDGSSLNSFPSGHTATAFMGAEILRREYWDVSPWIGVAGYAVAAGTGFFRMYNNRHWLTDVIAGAGFGILCAEAAYWLYPVISKTFFPKLYERNVYLSPSVSPRQLGVACSFTF